MSSWRPREAVKPKKLSAKAWGLWLQKLADMFLASGGALAIFGEEDDSLRLCAGHNLDLKSQSLVLKTGEGSLGRAALQGRPCILGPWPEEKMRLAGGKAIAYAAAAPVVWEDKTWGAIGVFRAGGEGYFEERDLSILATMGEMAALQFVAGEGPEVGHEGREPREHLKGIEEAGRSLGLAFDVGSAVNTALDTVTELFEASNASVMLVDKDDYLVRRAARGISEDILRGARQKLGEGISGWVAQSRQPLLLNGAVDDPRFRPTNAATKAAMSIPLHSGDKVYGVLNVSHVTSGGVFHQEDIDALVGIGDRLAIALENARRYAQVEEDRKLALALYELSRAVACGRGDQETLNVVTEMVASYMAASLCLILGLDQKRECLELRAGHGLGSPLPGGLEKEIASLSLMNVMRERKTRLLSRTEMGASEVLLRAGGMEYFLAGPLIAAQGVTGVIVVGRSQGQTFGPGDSTLFSALARIAAIALSSIAAEEEHKEAIVGRERNRIAQEIHDGLAQEMTSTVLALEACQRLLKKDAKGAEVQLARAISEARACLGDVRRYVTTLRSTGETEVGLVPRLQRLVEEFSQQTGEPAGAG
jgi:GAF domain-containing protein